jgi:pantetheine-phosphate adenylyltransferase
MTQRLRHALFPGTFDPFTLGHLDLVRRALHVFGKLTIGVAHNAEKRSMFEAEERAELVREATRSLDGAVEVVLIEGLVVEAAKRLGANVLVRGVRSGTDFDFETQMALTNRQMLPLLDTVFFVPDEHFAHVSSTLVRQIAQLGGDVRPFVPPNVAEALAKRARR